MIGNLREERNWKGLKYVVGIQSKPFLVLIDQGMGLPNISLSSPELQNSSSCS